MPTSEYVHPDKEDGSVSAAQYEPNPNSSPGSAKRKRIAMGLCIFSAQLIMWFVANFITSAAFLTVFLTVLYAIIILAPTHGVSDFPVHIQFQPDWRGSGFFPWSGRTCVEKGGL